MTRKTPNIDMENTFDLKKYLTENILVQELAVERAVLQKYFYEFLKQFENELGDNSSEMDNTLAQELQSHLKKYNTVENMADLPNIIRSDADEFDNLFGIMSEYYNFGMEPKEVTNKFITFLDNKTK
jgi:hypothetical protein